MSTETIYVSKQANGTGLHLSDNEGHSGDGSIITVVHQGDTVIWEVVSGGGITKITAIVDTDINDLFSGAGGVEPVSQNSEGTIWQGTISTAASGSESYCIHYEIDGTPYTHDPELDVHV